MVKCENQFIETHGGSLMSVLVREQMQHLHESPVVDCIGIFCHLLLFAAVTLLPGGSFIFKCISYVTDNRQDESVHLVLKKRPI